MKNSPLVMAVGAAIVALIAGAGAGYAYKAHADSFSGVSVQALPAKLQSLGYSMGTSETSNTPGGFTGMPGGLTGRGGVRGGRGGNSTAGQIISKDSTSITIKDATGSTKTVYVGASTTVTNFVQGNLADLTSGKSVNVTGTSNSDGSVTATNVQIRPLTAPSPAAN